MIVAGTVFLMGVGEFSFAGNYVYEKKGRDPFWPLVTESGKVLQGFDVATLEDIYLEGIIWDSKGDSIAMINGMILRKGDRIGDFEILKIEEDRVILQSANGHHLLTLDKDKKDF
ncbi:MAG: hypothetical protein HY590_07380 [Candidatus Omnitrophica bacterium]|nr:hypothetical protein [Candidatus Omnitrophota bacterium]